MGLNQEGIRLLADDLVANVAMYNQSVFGKVTECGTFACMAGLCFIRAYGLEKFCDAMPHDDDNFDWHRFGEICITAGVQQLGIKGYWGACPDIFNAAMLQTWGVSLSFLMDTARTANEKARIALEALQRLKPDGTIDAKPDACHNPLPEHMAMINDAIQLERSYHLPAEQMELPEPDLVACG